MLSTRPERSEEDVRVPIRVRDPDLDFDVGIPHHWLAGNAVATHRLNGLNLIFPDGERFFLRAVLDHLPRITDPGLRQQVKGFFGQEARHAGEHERFFAVLESQGYEVRRFTRRFRAFGRFTMRFPAALRLAMTAGAEHSTAIFGAVALEDELLLHRTHPTMRRLVLWHAIEEIEHKAVAFDILQATHPSRALRLLGFALVELVLFGWSLTGTRMLIRQDLRAGRLTREQLREMRRELRGHRLEIRRRVRSRMRAYLRRDFHPNQFDDAALARRRRIELGLPEGRAPRAATAPRVAQARPRPRVAAPTARSARPRPVAAPGRGGAAGRADPDPPVGLRGALAALWSTVAVLLPGAVLGLVAAELGLRLFTGLPNGMAFSVRAAYDLDDATIGPFEANAHVNITWPPETAFEAHFNSLGCRGPEPRAVDAPAILAVGDSLTLGLGVQDDQTWPAQLDRMLHERGTDRPVVNLSSAFLMIDDELHYLERALPVLHPGIVVLLLPPVGDGGYYDAQGRTQHQIGLEHERRTRHHVGGILRHLALSEARFYVDGWLRRGRLEGAGEYPPQIVPRSARQLRPPPRVAERYLAGVREFQQRVEAAGATLVVPAFPQASFEDGQLRFHSSWSSGIPQQIGAIGVDLAPAFDAQPDGIALTLLPNDAHASALGNQVLARSVLDTLVDRGLIH
jgi:uncharacterized protein